MNAQRLLLWVTGAAGALVVLTKVVEARTPNADEPTGDSEVTTDTMQDVAQAIAHAEGYYVPGSVPQRANNPGDLVIPGWTGAKLGDQGISVFSSANEGWSRLYAQLSRMFGGRSHVYTVDMTLAEVSEKWTASNSEDWANNVITYLNSKGYSVSAQTTLADLAAR